MSQNGRRRGSPRLPRRRIHLLCNAHIDPVWLWEWEEGAAAAISTFRTAAELCEAFPGFVFNHNEVTLYRWVEEYEPALFARIQKLVKQRKWHIMGGWYLQPDCNMPSGESFVRQILLGRRYFREKFGVAPTTAINFDPFGHTRGLVQILARSGFDSYLFCRPDQKDCPLPGDDFIWVGFDGSEVLGTRVTGWYNSPLGKADAKIRDRMKNPPAGDASLLLWGVGDHGGGPSRKDLERITALTRRSKDFDILHSTPEGWFGEVRRRRQDLPRHARDLNPWGVGCYTSMVRIKQRHRRLENELYATEKMCSVIAAQRLVAYPREELAEATRDLMAGEFHDILPGSAIQPVEETSLRMYDHALEILSRVKARAFFAAASGQPQAKGSDIPILVYNPHPYRVRTVVECEFQLADQNWESSFTDLAAFQNERRLPSQIEKELSNLTLDWRKRIAFIADLEPGQMNRFDCRVVKVRPAKPAPRLRASGGKIRFRSNELEVVINTATGLIDRYRVNGRDCVGAGACRPVVIADNEDPWGMLVRSFREVAGAFRLMSRTQAARFAGLRVRQLEPVRVIEDGAARSVVEALFRYGDSFICQRYNLPKEGTQIEIETRVHWNEKNRMLKLEIPTLGRKRDYLGQVAYGVDTLPGDGDEAVAQKWVAVVSREDDLALTVINDGIYGSDHTAQAGLRMTLLRSPAYSGHPFLDRPIVPQDRYQPRIDQGERVFRLWVDAGNVEQRLAAIDREALVCNEAPMALSFFPPGMGSRPKAGPILSDDAVQITCLKRAEENDDLIVRLFEPTGRRRTTLLTLPFLGMKIPVELGAFEIRTLRIEPKTRRVRECDLLEQPLGVTAGKT